MSNCFTQGRPNGMSNLFAVVNDRPYLIGEYLSMNESKYLDRSNISSAVHVDTSNLSKTTINIEMCRINTNTDSTIIPEQNMQLHQDLMNAIVNSDLTMKEGIPVLRNGLIARISYQLIDHRHGNVVKTMREDINIPKMDTYLHDICKCNDLSLVTNYKTKILSTINTFSHGSAKLVLKVVDVQLFYECINDDCGYEPKSFHVPGYNVTDKRYDKYHSYSINKNGNSTFKNGNQERPPVLHTENINRYYHYENKYERIVLHNEDIYDMYNKVRLIPCGSMAINRSFVVSPGERIEFRLSIWGNDVVVVDDTSHIARCLGIPSHTSYDCDCNTYDHHNHHKPSKHECSCNPHNKPYKNECCSNIHDGNHKAQKEECGCSGKHDCNDDSIVKAIDKITEVLHIHFDVMKDQDDKISDIYKNLISISEKLNGLRTHPDDGDDNDDEYDSQLEDIKSKLENLQDTLSEL